MKKKVILPMVLALVVAIACLPLFACSGGGGEGLKPNNGEGLKLGSGASVLTVKGEDEAIDYVIFTVNAEGIKDTTSVKDYMDALVKAGWLSYDGNNGSYGYYITSVMEQSEKILSSSGNSSEGYAWNLYLDFTTLEGDAAIYATDYTTKEIEGTTYYGASYGISGIPCVQGHTYVLSYDYYNYSW